MKYLVLLCDGMADLPVEALGGKTPMEVAFKPNMDNICKKSIVGVAKTVPDSLSPGSDVANLSVMGYDPQVFYTGRSPLEAASIGIDLADDDLAFRCNLVTLSSEEDFSQKTMLDYCAGDISTAESTILINDIQKEFGTDIFKFYPGISYRHCLVWVGGGSKIGTYTPPHDISGQKIADYLPKGPQTSELYEITKRVHAFLISHHINLKRLNEGKNPANSIWLWGYGKKPALTPFKSKNNLTGAVVSAVDLVKGIGICASMKICNVEGATGYLDTDFEGKTNAALDAFKNGTDYVYLHFEAPDECGHRGEIANKIKSIEIIDKIVLATLLKRMDCYDDYKILIMPDHPTPLCTKTHSREPVPFLIFQKSVDNNNNISCFSENSAKKTGIYFSNSSQLQKEFLG